ncbi:hypothetical protein [Poritiphilus flavus]|uniref:MG2 domain-containing protein n=1 Tax=Poritiphilus flavus TaxID=2697053 RepID=A0A6L9EEY9_9FLAO|nr:hypothetical protein [Poritiphilus flavus]NAS13068.1 hypothetical protein [Poritiphilus flavus]
MKKTISLLFCLAVFCLPKVEGQVIIKSEEELQALKQTPLESLYLHQSSSILFPGEYLYYSIYCLNTRSLKMSNISQVAYVELLGEDGSKIFTNKIKLRRGMGQGDFFLPVDVPSGNYKLVAYTNWMKNAGSRQFFKSDLAVINPYRSDQSAILASEEEVQDSTTNVLSNLSTDSPVALLTDKDTYGNRERVELILKNYRGNLGFGTYSLSVRKLDDFKAPPQITATANAEEYSAKLKEVPNRVNSVVFIPEQRGELFSGRVVNANTGDPVKKEYIGVSLPGKDFQTKSALTDDKGNFVTYLNKPYNTDIAVLQLMDGNQSPHKYTIADLSDWDFDLKDFYNFKISVKDREAILERSLNNQLENAYFQVKPDTLKAAEVTDPFDGEIPLVFELEDYTRFGTLRETLVEVVEHVWVKKEDKDSYTFWVREPLEPLNSEYTAFPPLVTIDGILVPDHNSILDYDARSIKSIGVLRDRYVLGSKTYQGLVVLETLNGDYIDKVRKPSNGIIPLLKPSPEKEYYRPAYTEENSPEFARIPDFRTQLLWEPRLVVQSPEIPLPFYTSDVAGTYEIRLEGYTSYGKPISLQKIFTVSN